MALVHTAISSTSSGHWNKLSKTRAMFRAYCSNTHLNFQEIISSSNIDAGGVDISSSDGVSSIDCGRLNGAKWEGPPTKW